MIFPSRSSCQINTIPLVTAGELPNQYFCCLWALMSFPPTHVLRMQEKVTQI